MPDDSTTNQIEKNLIQMTRPVGATATSVSALGFGAAPIGNLYEEVDEDQALSAIRAAYDAGVRYFDTAPYYGYGLSESRLGRGLRDLPRSALTISTKVGRRVHDDAAAVGRRDGFAVDGRRAEFDYSRDGVLRSIESSLRRLDTDHIDILLLHDIGRFSQGKNHDEALAEATTGGGIRALEELRAEGVVRAIGAGVNEWQIIDELMNHARWDVFLLANRYTLLDQEVIDRLFPRIEAEGVAIVIGAALNSGILLTGAVPGAIYDYAPAPEAILEKTRRIEAICKRHGVPLIRAALNFPLAHPVVTALLPGMSRTSELEENFGHLGADIPAAFWTELRVSGLLHPKAPLPALPALRRGS